MQTTPLLEGPVAVRGAAELEPTADGVVVHRLPAEARSQIPDDFVRMCEQQPSGVRLVFRTAARRIELDVRAYRTVSVNRPSGVDGPLPDAGRYELVVGGQVVHRAHAEQHGVFAMDFGARRATSGPAPVATVAFPGLPEGEKEVEIWLPFDEITRLVALRTDAPVTAPSGLGGLGPRWVHHGSSISHGASADVPTGTWPAVAARRLGLDLVNLGLSGNAVLDPFVARTIRDQTADLITLKLGINVVNHDCFRLRTFTPALDGFLDTIREGHPTTPIVIMSPLLCPQVEDRPGPTEIDPDSPPHAPVFRTLGRPEEVATGKLSLSVIREVLEAVVARRSVDDRWLTYLDGRELFGPREWDAMPMPDQLHPDAAGQRHVGARVAELLPSLVPGLPTGVGSAPSGTGSAPTAAAEP